MPRAEVAGFIVEDWLDGFHSNDCTQAEWEDIIEELALAMAVGFELKFGGIDARLSLAEAFRKAADLVEARSGELIQGERRMKKILGGTTNASSS
jgi:hypothetical protein